MTPEQATAIAIKSVDAIIEDISDRSALGNAWEEIDADIQEEIRQCWITEIVRRTIEVKA